MVHRLTLRQEFKMYTSIKVQKTLNISLTLDQDWHAFLGHGDPMKSIMIIERLFQCHSRKPSFRLLFLIFCINISSWLVYSRSCRQTSTQFSFCCSIINQVTNFAATQFFSQDLIAWFIWDATLFYNFSDS